MVDVVTAPTVVLDVGTDVEVEVELAGALVVVADELELDGELEDVELGEVVDDAALVLVEAGADVDVEVDGELVEEVVVPREVELVVEETGLVELELDGAVDDVDVLVELEVDDEVELVEVVGGGMELVEEDVEDVGIGDDVDEEVVVDEVGVVLPSTPVTDSV